MDEVTVTATVDARHLSCPMPVLRARQAIGRLAAGEVLEVVTTDRGSLKDIPAWARTAELELLATTEEDGLYRFFVRKP